MVSSMSSVIDPSGRASPTVRKAARRVIEFDPQQKKMEVLVDTQKEIGIPATGFAAQSKIHTRNNVGQLTGKIYFGSKQGYPDKGEKLTDYPGGYVLAYDPKTGQTENFGLPLKHSGIISVTPDEERAVAVSR